jgi:cell division protein FtsL
MSTAAAKNFPVVSGSTAPAIRTLPAGAGRKERTPLSVVRSAPKKRRAPFVVMCFALLAVALVAVLVLNLSVSTSQYQLVELRSKQSTLTKQNQDLTQQVQNFEAPQNLAAKAADLGMVPSTVKGQIDLSTLAVTGKATPAVKGGAAGSVIPAPAVAGMLTVVPPAQAADPLTDRQPAAPAPVPAPAVAPAPTPPVPAVDLHGGSVPVPGQKAPGNKQKVPGNN